MMYLVMMSSLPPQILFLAEQRMSSQTQLMHLQPWIDKCHGYHDAMSPSATKVLCDDRLVNCDGFVGQQ